MFLLSCSGGKNKKEGDTGSRPAKGNVKYGGIFRYNESEFLKSIYPLSVTEVTGHRVAAQIYEGLVRFNPKDLTVEPCLATSWDVNNNATVYTFKLRQGVRFHDDPCFEGGKGRAVTAADFVYVFNMVCTPDPKNHGFTFFRDVIAGAEELYLARQRKENEQNILQKFGVKALNDTVLQITLRQPTTDLLQRLALPFASVFPKEAVDKYGSDILYHAVGTGPFMLKALKQDDAVILTRNPHYWDVDEYGNQLPYLDGIKVSFMKEEKNEMLAFIRGDLEMKYRLPFDMIDEIVDDKNQLKEKYKQFQLQVTPELSTQFYGFLVPDKLMSNKYVRLAFNYAIDRKAIADYTAKGEGTPCLHGFVPLGMPGYDNTLVKGYTYDVAKAKEYLAKAGYPDGKGFPKITLEINSGGGRNEKIAEAIQKMLMQNLNIQVEIAQVVWAQHTNNVETGKTNFWRFGWVADYPDPVNFLQLFYGKNVPATMDEASYTNPTRYKNPAYDALLEKAMRTTDTRERNKLYAQLDQMIVDDAPVMLIMHSMNRRLLQPYVRNFPVNGMEYRSFRDVWFDK
ncbi:MAG: ABC transporter substrate-binding protein [Chitinophagales bacterium]|nr:ABC transporter substrate-binding protein [Chitinophagales bacterium]MDW8419224.1 ABC transporter substrate-binding protein [Chitinophagales bacterium]